MSQSISIPKSVFEDITDRINRLEEAVFKNSHNRVFGSVKQYEEEKKQGKLSKLKSIDELFS